MALLALPLLVYGAVSLLAAWTSPACVVQDCNDYLVRAVIGVLAYELLVLVAWLKEGLD